jgi:hypothetical protein
MFTDKVRISPSIISSNVGDSDIRVTETGSFSCPQLMSRKEIAIVIN